MLSANPDTITGMYPFISIAAAALAVTLCGAAHAQPEDPYGEDYVSFAKPITAQLPAGYGMAGTQQLADTIALAECRSASGQDCMIVANNHHGCVGYAVGDIWRSAQGATPDAAEMNAREGVTGDVYVVSYCST